MSRLNKNVQNIITSILLMVIGFALIVAPANIFALILRIIGALILLLELVKIVNLVRFYAKSPKFTAVLLNEILIAVIALIVLINPIATIWVLTRVLGVYLMLTSLLRIAAYSRMPKNAQIWVAIVLDGLTALAGFWLLIQPAALSELVGLFLGIAVLVKAISLLADTVTEKKKGKNDDYITTDFKDKTDEK